MNSLHDLANRLGGDVAGSRDMLMYTQDLVDIEWLRVTAATACYNDLEEASVLDELTLHRLRNVEGIALNSVAGFPMALRSRVSFESEANRYTPTPMGELALVFGVLDYDDCGNLVMVDLTAWRRGQVGIPLGIGACLAQEQIGQDGLGMADRPLPIFRSALAWLQHERRGLVVAAWEAAAHLLSDVALRPDERHGDELSRRLRELPPIILTAQEASHIRSAA